MKAARIDDIFQVKCGVPIIAGFYIGMEEDKAAELLEELTEYKTHHSCEYPADLIYNNKISFRYKLFKESYRINMIEVTFPKGAKGGDRNKLFKDSKEYFSEKYYHEDIHCYIENYDQEDIFEFKTYISNYFYQFKIETNKEKLIIELKAKLISDDIYSAINVISQDIELMEFVRKSLHICKDYDGNNKKYAEVMPFFYGIPRFIRFELGDEGICGNDCGWLKDYIDDYQGNSVCEDYDIGYEITLGSYDCVNSIVLSIPKDSDGLWPLMNYIRGNFLIEDSNVEIIYDYEEKFKDIKGYMNNKYVSISFNRPFYANSDKIYITIKSLDEDHPEIYRALYTVLKKDYIFSFFVGVKRFYKYSNPTQDAKFNDLRRKFKSFEAAANYYTAEMSAWARDMGGYSKEEYERDKEDCLRTWNTPDSKGFPMSWANVCLPD